MLRKKKDSVQLTEFPALLLSTDQWHFHISLWDEYMRKRGKNHQLPQYTKMRYVENFNCISTTIKKKKKKKQDFIISL